MKKEKNTAVQPMKEVHNDVEKYLINRVECSRDKCAALARELAEGNDNGKLKIQKKRKIKDIQYFAEDTHTDTASFSFSFKLPCILFNRIIHGGQNNYDKLMDFALNIVDSGVMAEKDFGDHFERFDRDIRAFWKFYAAFTIDKNSPYFQEILQMDIELVALSFATIVFSMSRFYVEKNEGLIKRYGNACLPKVDLSAFAKREVGVLRDVASEKKFTGDILNKIAVLEKDLTENPCYIPEARDYALKKLSMIDAIAQKYNKIFTEALETSAVVEFGIFKKKDVALQVPLDDVELVRSANTMV